MGHQLRILPVLPEPVRKRPAKAYTPDDIEAASTAEAIRTVRALRRVYAETSAATPQRWYVISTKGGYRHEIILTRDQGGTLEPLCVATECRAPRANPCWALLKTIRSPSFEEAVRTLMEEPT